MDDDLITRNRHKLATDKKYDELKVYRNQQKRTSKETAQIKEKQRRFGLDGSIGKYASHVYQVFCDPDFDAEIKKLRKQFDDMYYPNISLTTNCLDEHLILQDREKLRDFADKYCISLEDLGIYADGYYEAGFEFGRLMYDYGGFIAFGSEYLSSMPFFYAIGPKTTLQQITKDWSYIQAYVTALQGNANTKSKSPLNPELIYAVFKARSRGETFSSIFKSYQSRTLPGYKKGSGQYTSEDSLERYYRKYMPKPLHEVVLRLQEYEPNFQPDT